MHLLITAGIIQKPLNWCLLTFTMHHLVVASFRLYIVSSPDPTLLWGKESNDNWVFSWLCNVSSLVKTFSYELIRLQLFVFCGCFIAMMQIIMDYIILIASHTLNCWHCTTKKMHQTLFLAKRVGSKDETLRVRLVQLAGGSSTYLPW